MSTVGTQQDPAQLASMGLGLTLTHHAATRIRQRGINLEVLGCLLSYGHREHDHRGAEVVAFDRSALSLVRATEAPDVWRAVEQARDVYAVVDSDGLVITSGFRFRRVVRDFSLSSMRPRRGHRNYLRGRQLQ